MKTSDKYRFTLQWGAETAEKMLAGDFLESLGNRKSEFIVMAVNEYLIAHPESMAAGRKLQIVIKPSVTTEQIKSLVLAMIEEKLSGMALVEREAPNSSSELTEIEKDVDEMLKNLDLFSQ